MISSITVNGSTYRIENLDGFRNWTSGRVLRRWSRRGRPILEIYTHNGSLFRTDGPALRYWAEDGELTLSLTAVQPYNIPQDLFALLNHADNSRLCYQIAKHIEWLVCREDEK
jgi:hypothetical protein